jgi:CheY-like chemotaxis protein
MVNKIKLLLIEDSPTEAMAIREMLEEATSENFDYTVEWADSLSKGLEHLSAAETDVVLCDLGLPDSNGLETFTKVYAHEPRVPIIVLTAMTDQMLAAKATLQKGAQDYLVKGQVDWIATQKLVQFLGSNPPLAIFSTSS